MERAVAERTALARVGGVLARSELAILPRRTAGCSCRTWTARGTCTPVRHDRLSTDKQAYSPTNTFSYNGSTTQAGSIGEGFGACIRDRDATAYTQDVPHCLRRADTDKHWPEDRTNEVHADGEIWSAALYDVNRAVGRERTDTAILEGQFSLTPGTTFAAAAEDIVAAALELYGPRVASVVQRAFYARGFI